MSLLILGLVIFLGTHSINLVAPDWRQAAIERLGKNTWKIAFSLLSLIGLLLIIHGYGQARTEPLWLWHSPVWTRHLAALLTLPAMILLVATYVPGNRIRAKLGHPMLLGVKLWAFAHLIANGSLADVLLFGGFLLWSIAGFAILRRRDRLAGASRAPGATGRDIITVIIGLVLWAAIAFYLHRALIGVAPLG
ncbi:NnrU family protein [Marinimicrobium sp. ARAG 43.8]|uniref:NnrU family protein n=1 Tax=Marinimicrobium sp. ARAG 43.8 TaxID=3418719 RepID=UPI003CE95267